jgi:hypothetical protein
MKLTLYLATSSRTSLRSPLVKMSPTFPYNNHGNTNRHTETLDSDENQNGTSGEKKTHDEGLAELFKLFAAGLLGVHLDAAPDERVLAHEHDGVAPEPAADVL